MLRFVLAVVVLAAHRLVCLAQGNVVLLVGSSVCAGFYGAIRPCGYSGLLGSALAAKNYQLVNLAVPGTNAAWVSRTLPGMLKEWKPNAVIIGLSLANEGMIQIKDAKLLEKLGNDWLEAISGVVDIIAAAGARPIILGVYPNGDAESIHRDTLYTVDSKMTSGGWKAMSNVSVVSWLKDMDGPDHDGRWRAGEASDPGHPNAFGHERFFSHIDVDTLFPLKLPAPTASIDETLFCSQSVRLIVRLMRLLAAVSAIVAAVGFIFLSVPLFMATMNSKSVSEVLVSRLSLQLSLFLVVMGLGVVIIIESALLFPSPDMKHVLRAMALFLMILCTLWLCCCKCARRIRDNEKETVASSAHPTA